MLLDVDMADRARLLCLAHLDDHVSHLCHPASVESLLQRLRSAHRHRLRGRSPAPSLRRKSSLRKPTLLGGRAGREGELPTANGYIACRD